MTNLCSIQAIRCHETNHAWIAHSFSSIIKIKRKTGHNEYIFSLLSIPLSTGDISTSRV